MLGATAMGEPFEVTPCCKCGTDCSCSEIHDLLALAAGSGSITVDRKLLRALATVAHVHIHNINEVLQSGRSLCWQRGVPRDEWCGECAAAYALLDVGIARDRDAPWPPKL